MKKPLLAALALAAAITACDPKDGDIAVTAVEITATPSPLALTVGGATGKVSGKVVPADATNQTLAWTVAPAEGVVTLAADGTVTAAGAGTAVITATASNGVKSTCDVTVTVPQAKVYKYKGTFTVAAPYAYTQQNADVTLTIAADEKTADLVMYKPKFAEGMPPTMDITVPGIAVAVSIAAVGIPPSYDLSGDEIIPTAVMGGNPIGEVPTYTMIGFSGTASAQSLSFSTKTNKYDLTFSGAIVAE